MKTFNSAIKLISWLGLFGFCATTAFADCAKWSPPESSFYDYVSWDIDVRSLLVVNFDTDKNGKIDYIETYRQSPAEYGIDIPNISPDEIKRKYPNNKILSIKSKKRGKQTDLDYVPSPGEGIVQSTSGEEDTKERYRHYVVNKYPLYQILDRDEDGHYDIILIDPEEDGFNGNEKVDYCGETEDAKKHYIRNPEIHMPGDGQKYEIVWPAWDKVPEIKS